MEKIETIYVHLPEEAVDCWYPARAENLGGDAYLLIDPSPQDLVLQFKRGEVVRCRLHPLTAAMPPYTEEKVAYEKIESREDARSTTIAT